jgi:hypothetical protein
MRSVTAGSLAPVVVAMEPALRGLEAGCGTALNFASIKPQAGQAAGAAWFAGSGAWPHLGQAG